MQRTIDHNDTTKKERGKKILLKNKPCWVGGWVGGWEGTILCWPAMLLARLNNLSKYVLNIKYLHGQLHYPVQNKELCGNMLIGPHTRVPPII